MDLSEISINYESQGKNNYVCIQVQDDLSRYQERMLGSGSIPGVLAMSSTVFNGVNKLSYDISHKRRLSDMLKSKEITGQNAKRVLYSIAKILSELEEYFLSLSTCILEPDYIFVGSGLELGLVCIPFSERTIADTESIIALYNKLLVEYMTDENDIFFVSLLKYVCNKNIFSLGGLLEQMEPKGVKESNVVVNTQPGQPMRVAATPTNIAPTKPSIASERPLAAATEKHPVEVVEKKPVPQPPVSNGGFGFSIPGNVSMSVPPTHPTTPEKTGKGGGLLGIFRGHGGKESSSEDKNKGQMEIPVAPIQMKGTKDEEKAVSGVKPASIFSKPTPAQGSTAQVDVSAPANEEEVQTTMATLGPKILYHGKTIDINYFPFKIGNGKIPGMNLVISGNTVSRHHATIYSNNEKYYVRDENSSNHTYVNGKQIAPFTEIEIVDEDRIRLANEEIIFTIVK